MNYPDVTLINGRRSLLQEAPVAAVRSQPSDHSTMLMIILLLSTTLLVVGFCSVPVCRYIFFEARRRPPPSNPDRPPMNCKGGVQSSAVDSLPVAAYGEAAKHRRMSDDCPISLGEFEESVCVKLIPYCGHVFHPTCIDTWLDTHVTCPVCRSAQLFKKVHEEVCMDVMQDENHEMMMGKCEIGEPSTVGIETRGGTSL